ncbi:MAG TPA: RNA polymerase sigma factor SigJ [Rariglobus sp.]
MSEDSPDRTEFFMRHQTRLRALGYRLLGSVSDAEDIVQEAYLRWSKAEPAHLDQPAAYLSRIVTRLCIDHLKSARARRETYVGPWLPEPLVAATEWTADSEAGVAHDVSYAFILLLDRLSPAERAAFVLHDVFGLTFEDIAATLDRTPASCRQLASRARMQLRPAPDTTPATTAKPEHPAAGAFIAALKSGDIEGLRRSLTADAVLVSDGGAKVRAARRPILGREKIARMFARLSAENYRPHDLLPAVINGLPGLVVRTAAGIAGTFAFEMEGDRIHRVYVVRNPEKLRHLAAR